MFRLYPRRECCYASLIPRLSRDTHTHTLSSLRLTIIINSCVRCILRFSRLHFLGVAGGSLSLISTHVTCCIKFRWEFPVKEVAAIRTFGERGTLPFCYSLKKCWYHFMLCMQCICCNLFSRPPGVVILSFISSFAVYRVTFVHDSCAHILFSKTR